VCAQRSPGPARAVVGAWVLLESRDGAQSRYRIVGPDEFDRAPGYISMDSPLGRAVLRKPLDDEVIVAAPGGSRAYVIVSIEYPRDSPSAKDAGGAPLTPIRAHQSARTCLNHQGALRSRAGGK